MVPPLLYTSIPAGVVAVNGATEFILFNAILGGSKPMFVLSNSSKELALMVFGLLPIFTYALA